MFKALVALTTPLLPEDYLSLVDPLWSTTELRGRVVGVHRETERATTLRIRPGRAWAGHRAGQYVRVGVDVDGVRHWRTYSLTGAETDEHLTITVQALPDGVVSRHLVDATPVGSIVRLEQAAGDFVLPSPVPAKLLMITAGSGITPVMGMLRTLDGHPDAVVLHSAPTAQDVLFDAELRALPGVTVRTTRDQGRLDLADLDDLCPDWRDREAYVCGPAGLLDAAEEHWGDARARLHLERFTPPARSTGGEGGTVTYGGTTVDVDGGASLLEAGEEAGVLLPSGCRMGICFSCVLPLRDGQVRDLRTGEVHGEPGDLVQICITGATGSARLDLTR
ncbi:ferredoxin reductase [Pseudonocardia sp. KRD-184]|uniref:Ferredoxin reductase n=1 Tax=Pseudonocardia oceani TaxID=2792013 RepID=A0ABS6UE53_9PSEU|nr:ferredoxin reductase [Pseudonocardia oceani]MBW0091844.1 ferredoxin reductase [Pseudonocardia oceani]MBW0098326.1 ferredoxin reductase [Pseudonocardia oceani]MBW0110869.1 ferredoxin reductase [Pseudonocardia oceani]MBW0121969.1 ferredoxin reductase [Pseudonocardia oceani]MBW0130501.1 ferredoxin reductase [Pseudonocardia oceani]